jgi:hypothetical protein
MLTTPVVGIGAECLDDLYIHGGKVRMTSVKRAQQPIKVGRGTDGSGALSMSQYRKAQPQVYAR